jgi:hypothetical protein
LFAGKPEKEREVPIMKLRKLILFAIPIAMFGAAGALLLLVLSGRVSMDVPERIAASVRAALKKPLENLQGLKDILFGKQDPNKGKPEYYDLY